MAVSSLMSLGAQAMFANYAALQATGNNISNANTAGYSRQQVELQTVEGQFSGSGYFGRGVDVATVTRLHNEFLTREAAATHSTAAADATLSRQLQQLERVFQPGEAGIGHAAGQLFNAFADVASKPQDIASRQVVLARSDELAARFRGATDQLQALQTGINQDLKSSVASANSLTRQIAGLNNQIAAVVGFGHSPNDLLDQRDGALSKLSELLQVSTVSASDGTVSVFMGGGQNLVLGNQAVELTTVADAFDPSKLQVGVRQAGIDRQLPTGLLTGGSIAGLVAFQNRDLIDARNQLGQMAAAVTDQLNRQQGLGLDLNGGAGGALLKIAAPQVLAGRGNSGTATVEIARLDTSQLRASDYELSRDSDASYSLRRLSDNHLFGPPELPTLTPALLDAGVQVDGMTIRVASGAGAAIGDRFLLQPLATAARDMALALNDPRGLAAASPVSAAASTQNSGTLDVERLQVLSSIAAPIADVVLRFDRDPATLAPTYTYSTDGGATFSASAQPLLPNRPISYPIGSASPQWSLSLRGAPAVGDTVRVQATPSPSANNGNANALLGLRDVAMVGAEVDNQSRNVIFAASSFGDAYAGVLANFGVRVQSANALARQSESVAEAAQSLASNTSGVNLDEEAARMIQYQQSYQAAAKMLQVAQTLFDTLLQATGR